MNAAWLCDVAEAEWGELEDRHDMLRLLAGIATSLGAKGLKGYDPPSEDIAESLRPRKAPRRATDPDARRKQVMAVVQAFGGEVG